MTLLPFSTKFDVDMRLIKVLVMAPILMAFCPSISAAQNVARPQSPGLPIYGPGGTAATPTLSPILPQDTDWRFLDKEKRGQRLKARPLNKDGSITSSVTVKSFLEFESFKNERFGAVDGWNPSVNMRLNIYGQIEGHDRWRLFGGVKSGTRLGSSVPNNPAQEDLDFHTGFVEIALGDVLGLNREDFLLRTGRFELHYGRGLMISAREGPNIRDDFDGVLARIKTGAVLTDVFAVYGAEDRPGAFNNKTDESSKLWGAYSSIPLKPGLSFDGYYMGDERESQFFTAGAAAETRHSIGVRLAQSRRTGWSYDVETIYQFGKSKPLQGGVKDIEAKTVAGAISYALTDVTFSPIISVQGGWSSGDKDPLDSVNQTFRAPYPPGRFFGDTTPFGPGNLVGANVSVALKYSDVFIFTPILQSFWRVETSDGIYGPPGFPVLDSSSSSKYLGTEIGFDVTTDLTSDIGLGIEFGHFLTGEGVGRNSPGKNVTRVATKLSLTY